MAALIFIIIFTLLAIAAFILAPRLRVEVANPAWDKYSRNDTTLRLIVTKWPNRVLRIAGALFAVVAAIILLANTFYTQTVGEASVIKSFTGQVIGFKAGSGLSTKAPWEDRIVYNILNQQAIFSNPNNVHGDQTKDLKGGEITVGDKDGVAANVDVVLRYSIRPDQVVDVFNHFGDQTAFESKLVTQDVRDVVRYSPNTFSTFDVLTKRQDLENKILENLKARWAKEGVQIESVALQDIRYPQSVTDKFAAALNARTGQAQAEAELAATKISSQQKVVQAQAEADANAILAKSLTPEILKQRELDTMRAIGEKGNTFFMGNGSASPLVNVGK